MNGLAQPTHHALRAQKGAQGVGFDAPLKSAARLARKCAQPSLSAAVAQLGRSRKGGDCYGYPCSASSVGGRCARNVAMTLPN